MPGHAALLLPRRRGLLRALIGSCPDVLPRLLLSARVLRVHDTLMLRVLRCCGDAGVDDALTRLLLLLLLLLLLPLLLLLLLESFPLRL